MKLLAKLRRENPTSLGHVSYKHRSHRSCYVKPMSRKTSKSLWRLNLKNISILPLALNKLISFTFELQAMHSFNIASVLLSKQAKTCFVCKVRSLSPTSDVIQRALEDTSTKVRYDLSALLAPFQKLLLISNTMQRIVDNQQLCIRKICKYGSFEIYWFHLHSVVLFVVFTSTNMQIYLKLAVLRLTCFGYIFLR